MCLMQVGMEDCVYDRTPKSRKLKIRENINIQGLDVSHASGYGGLPAPMLIPANGGIHLRHHQTNVILDKGTYSF